MIFYFGILPLQILCIVDVVRRGRNQLWIVALIMLPLASAVAYLIVEVLPGHGNNRHVRTARARAVKAIDPEREVRAARDALDLADTVANRVRLADALAALERWGAALPLYREALAMTPSDTRTGFKAARALFETGTRRARSRRWTRWRRLPGRASVTGTGCCALGRWTRWAGATRRRRSMPTW